jgi:hypothetical protein
MVLNHGEIIKAEDRTGHLSIIIRLMPRDWVLTEQKQEAMRFHSIFRRLMKDTGISQPARKILFFGFIMFRGIIQ